MLQIGERYMKKIAVFLADGFEEVEGLTVVDLCRRAGIDTIMVSIMSTKKVIGAHEITVEADLCLQDLDFSSMDMLVLPGGLNGTRKLEGCEELMKQFDEFNQNGKCISAICAAPTVFGHRGYLKNRKACCYPGLEDELLDAIVSYDEVVVSDHITTSRGLGTAIVFALAIVKRYCGEDTAAQLAKKVVYK